MSSSRVKNVTSHLDAAPQRRQTQSCRMSTVTGIGFWRSSSPNLSSLLLGMESGERTEWSMESGERRVENGNRSTESVESGLSDCLHHVWSVQMVSGLTATAEAPGRQGYLKNAMNCSHVLRVCTSVRSLAESFDSVVLVVRRHHIHGRRSPPTHVSRTYTYVQTYVHTDVSSVHTLVYIVYTAYCKCPVCLCLCVCVCVRARRTIQIFESWLVLTTYQENPVLIISSFSGSAAGTACRPPCSGKRSSLHKWAGG